MVDNEKTIQEIAEQICSMEGVEKVRTRTIITVSHKKVNTGETNDVYNPIRERVVDEEAFEEVAEDLGLEHSGTVDVVGDFRLKDKFSTNNTIEPQDLQED